MVFPVEGKQTLPENAHSDYILMHAHWDYWHYISFEIAVITFWLRFQIASFTVGIKCYSAFTLRLLMHSLWNYLFSLSHDAFLGHVCCVFLCPVSPFTTVAGDKQEEVTAPSSTDQSSSEGPKSTTPKSSRKSKEKEKEKEKEKPVTKPVTRLEQVCVWEREKEVGWGCVCGGWESVYGFVFSCSFI